MRTSTTIPTSPRASLIGLPALRASSRDSFSASCATAAAKRRMSFARSPGVTARQAGKAALALATAWSASSRVASGTSARTSSVAGSMTFTPATIGRLENSHRNPSLF